MNRVSVIIPVKDDAQRLAACLRRLLPQVHAGDIAEILVVDNGSREPLAGDWSNEPAIRILSCPIGGSYAARNAGIAAASGDVLAFTDADCLPAADWLQQGVQALQRTGAAIIAGHIEVFPANAASPSGIELYEMMFAFPQQLYVENDGFGVTANLVVRREAFTKVGLFNAELHSGGDREWGRRAGAAGLHLVHEPRCLVRHPARRTMVELKHKLRRVIHGLHEVDLRGPEGAAEARRRARKAIRHPIKVLTRAWLNCPSSRMLDRLALCAVVARMRWQTAREYRLAARRLSLQTASTTQPRRSEPLAELAR